MTKAIWKGVVLAESDETKVVEGNHYFSPDSVNWDYFKKNDRSSVCPWKGTARYYDVEVEGQVNRSAAWVYPNPSSAARKIKDHVAFWNGVKVVKGDGGSSEGIMQRIRSLFS